MNETAISWTNVTWNPVHGCSKVSEGCRNCYAEALSLKRGWTKKPWTQPNAAENVMLKPAKLRDPYKIKDPSRIFVNSMSDLFHELIPDDYITRVFEVMNDLPRHTFQILTKRPGRAASWPGPWSPNIWMGTSIEDQRAAHRLDDLRPCQAQTLFISFEPLIGPIADVNLSGYAWAIVGGESGPHRRPMPHAWARAIRDLCRKEGIAFFFKQSAAWRTELGTALQHEDGTFWKWEQYPGWRQPPTQAPSHSFTS